MDTEVLAVAPDPPIDEPIAVAAAATVTTIALPAPPFPDSAFHGPVGAQVHYRVQAPKSTPTGYCVLIHGLGGSTFDWRKVAPLLQEAKVFSVLVDLPGFGHSDRSPTLNHRNENRAQLLWSIIDTVKVTYHLPLDVKFVFVGHSMGAMTALHMGQQRPSETKGVAIVCGLIEERYSFPCGSLFKCGCTRYLARKISEKTLQNRPRMLQLLRDNGVTDPMTEAEERALAAVWEIPGSIDTILDMATQVDTQPVQLDSFPLPVLCYWGALDKIVPYAKRAVFVKRIPQHRVLLRERCYHIPLLSHPVDLAATLAAFVKSGVLPDDEGKV
jgi:pimeloyl-ACP methyl ester carboxylesterase